MRRVLPWIVLLTIPAIAMPAGAAERWTLVRSSAFTLLGNASEREIKGVERRLEQFREVLGRLLPGLQLAEALPTTVFVFRDNQSMAPYRPLFQGKPIELGGYFGRSPTGQVIVLSLQWGEDAYPVIYHEYTHQVLSNSFSALPLWLSEGLAEYYRSFRLMEGGRTAAIGGMEERHIVLLREQPMPLAEMFAVTPDSPVYNDGRRRSVFYAQCWAFTHYALQGNKARAPQFQSFMNLLLRGVAPAPAFEQAFGTTMKALDQEISNYLGGRVFMATKYQFPDQLAVSGGASGGMSEADVLAALGRLLMELHRTEEAERLLQRALALDPGTPAVHTWLGLLRHDANQREEGLRSLEKGAELAPGDAFAHYLLGRALLQDGQARPAAAALQRAVGIEPGFPAALAELAEAYLQERVRLDEACAHLARAAELVPGKEDYRLRLADAHVARADYKAAREVLGPLLALSPAPETKERARALMARVAERQTGANVPAAGADTSPTIRPATGEHSKVVPLLRAVRAGEERVEGLLERIECDAVRIVLVVDQNQNVLRFTAPNFDAVEFITYRDDLRGSIPCGPRTPVVPVLITYKRSLEKDAAGVAVAVEFLPR